MNTHSRESVVFGVNELSEAPGNRAYIHSRMLRSSRDLGVYLRPPGCKRPFEALSPVVSLQLRTMLGNLERKTSASWFRQLHFAAAEYAQCLSGFPPALHPVMQLLYFEPLLNAEPTGKWYKDHLVHQLRVTRKLFLLLEAWQRRSGWRQMDVDVPLYPAALLAGLFHDVGYPLAMLKALTNNKHQTHWDSSFMVSFDRLEKVVTRSEIAQRLISFGITHDPNAWIRAQLSKGGSKTHAFLSGLWLLDFKEEILQRCRSSGSLQKEENRDLAKLEAIFERAAAATFFHHIYEYDDIGIAVRPSVSDHPLLVLLQLADVLQEWGRPIITRDSKGHLDFEIPGDCISIYRCDDDLGLMLASPGRDLCTPPLDAGKPELSSESVSLLWKKWIADLDGEGGNTICERMGEDFDRAKLHRLVRAGWKPWLPCTEIPKTLAKLDPKATNLIWTLPDL